MSAEPDAETEAKSPTATSPVPPKEGTEVADGAAAETGAAGEETKDAGSRASSDKSRQGAVELFDRTLPSSKGLDIYINV